MKVLKKDGSIISIFLLIIIWLTNTSESLRILGIFPFQAKSHFVIFESLMKGLAKKGHEVDVYSHFPLKNPIPNYNDFSLAGTLPQILNNMTYEYIQRFRELNIKEIHKLSAESVCELMNLPLFQDLLKTSTKYDAVIVEVKALLIKLK